MRYLVVGDIAIVGKNRDASAIVKKNPSIKVVLRRKDYARGRERIHSYEILIGNRTWTIHTENGCRFYVDLSKTFFSPRLSAERARILSLTTDGERIFCGFSGVGPFPIVLARHRRVDVLAVELGKDAFEMMKRNAELNKVSIRMVNGDVRDVLNASGLFSRIILPTPKVSPEKRFEYFRLAKDHLLPDGILHYYTFASSREIEKWKDVVRMKRCGSFAPSIYRVVVDWMGGDFPLDRLL